MVAYSKPLIAVTAGHVMPNYPNLYIEALIKAGAMAEFIYPSYRKRDLVDHYDGFLIPGGKDISPSRYGEKSLCLINHEDVMRTDFELFLLRKATEKNKPVFGICYGMQVINVFFKGTLFQDIKFQIDNSIDHNVGSHNILFQDNFFLNGEHEVNSSHHQSVKKLGKGLVAVATSNDGIIEAILHKDFKFIFGVQWHPERLNNKLSEMLFRLFVEACRGRQ